MFCLFSFCLFVLNFVSVSVNGDNLWYKLGLLPEFSLDFCYFSGNDTQTLGILTSAMEDDESIETYLISAFKSILVSSGFNLSSITLPYYSLPLTLLDDLYPYSFRCYSYSVQLNYQDDDSNYQRLYYKTDDLDLITLSKQFTSLMIEVSKGTLNNDFKMIVYGAYLLCDIKSSLYCDTDNRHYKTFSTLTQETELYEQVSKGTDFISFDNDYIDYNEYFVLTIRLMQIVVIEDGSDEEILCENGFDKISDNMQNYFGGHSDNVFGSSWIYCDPNNNKPNGTNTYIAQNGIFHIIWTNKTAFYIDYINHGNFSTNYFGNSINSWTSNVFTTIINGDGTFGTSEEEILSVVISCNGKKTTICNVNEYFGEGKYGENGSFILSFPRLILFSLLLINVVFMD